MEVILIKPIKKLGQIGSNIKVADGFARNYLIPNKFAIISTIKNKQLIDKQKHDFELKDNEFKINVTNISNIINNKEIIFIKHASQDGKLFGSVNNKEIASLLSKTFSYKFSYLSIILNNPIKNTGLFNVEVKMHAELSANIIVIVAQNQSQVHDYLDQVKNIKSNN